MSQRSPIVLSLLFLASAVFYERPVQAQDPQFTQFYANPLYLNPAFAGTNRCPRVILNYRNQWPALTGNFVTYAASYDQYFDAMKGGLGFQVMHDEAGVSTLKTTTVNMMYSYQTPISKTWSMALGGQAAYFQKSLDWSKLTFGDQIDPRRGFVFETRDTPRGGTVSNFSFSAGALFYNETFYGGFAVHHLNEPNESLIVGTSRLPMKYTVHGGAVIPLNKDVRGESETSISPNLLYQRQQDFEQYNVGLYLQKGPLVGGLWYRFSTRQNTADGPILSSDSFILLLGIQADQLRFGYSYDLTVSRLGVSQTAGSHEISCALLFNCAPQKKKFRAINCPTF